jgi:hypothetical protein
MRMCEEHKIYSLNTDYDREGKLVLNFSSPKILYQVKCDSFVLNFGLNSLQIKYDMNLFLLNLFQNGYLSSNIHIDPLNFQIFVLEIYLPDCTSLEFFIDHNKFIIKERVIFVAYMYSIHPVLRTYINKSCPRISFDNIEFFEELPADPQLSVEERFLKIFEARNESIRIQNHISFIQTQLELMDDEIRRILKTRKTRNSHTNPTDEIVLRISNLQTYITEGLLVLRNRLAGSSREDCRMGL